MEIFQILSKEFNIREEYSQNIIALIDEDNTVPFIARYRKEMTGGIDDQVLREFCDRLEYLKNLFKRKDEVRRAIEEQGKWTDELASALALAATMTEVEDIYRPYKQKRKTRASVAVEKGLQPLADIFLAQDLFSGSIEEIAAPFVDEEKGVLTVKDAIDGARDIVAEVISDNAETRKALREYLFEFGHIRAKAVKDAPKEKALVYDMYAEYAERINTVPSHRILAMNRGESEECLKVTLEAPESAMLSIIGMRFIKDGSITTDIVKEAAADAYKRLIFPSIERENRNTLTETANERAIKMFEVNLRPLLLQPPFKGKTILGFDPAYRTGCKIAVIDKNGNCLETTVVYPTPPQSKTEEAAEKLKKLIEKHGVEVVAIGNGTASKESEIFVADLAKRLNGAISYIVVNEAGASVYSASKLGAEEFPDFDVSLRSAVSIARRLLDPLAELIKIDVKAIGVGQYQHDMPQKRLTEVLDGVVEDCVNKVGVDLNTASASLLQYVAGLNSGIAKNVVLKRKEKPFKSRTELLDVPKLGNKAFEQCAGFLRIAGGANIFDNTGVHPESYPAALKLLERLGYSDADIKKGDFKDIDERLPEKDVKTIAEECGIGVPTLRDIAAELKKPGRDIRDSLPPPLLRSDLMSMEDLKAGMELRGTVRNVIDFGAFVDIGVHQDGLVHISQISYKFIKHPSELLKVGDIVKVWVLEVDLQKKKISLTMKDPAAKFEGGQRARQTDGNRKTSEPDLNSMLNNLKNKFN
ncbi:MAG: RNA-binding transcriptional accessory protein [Clostridiales bacterium]|jgi:uncharacterized protein|nr:RNA-binding transcriptional accessory protein [Clostridiales bacterium]